MGSLELKSRILEFLRYTVVGGTAFIADTAVLYLFREFILIDMSYSLYLSTAFGFIVGTAVNYYLCHAYVFLSVKDLNVGKSLKDIMLFIIIGIIGLLLNELGMFIGVEFLGLYYLIVKIGTASIVLMWNYLARKMLIFNIQFVQASSSSFSKRG
jgi:putative flippase GtrA